MKLTKPEPGKPILVEIGGQMLRLRYTLAILKELDHDHGISVFKAETFGQLLNDPEKMATVLHAGLKTEHPEITREWVEKEIDASMFPVLLPYLTFAMSGRWSKQVAKLAAGDDEEEETASPLAAAAPAPALSTGSPSGASVATISDSANRNSGG